MSMAALPAEHVQKRPIYERKVAHQKHHSALGLTHCNRLQQTATLTATDCVVYSALGLRVLVELPSAGDAFK